MTSLLACLERRDDSVRSGRSHPAHKQRRDSAPDISTDPALRTTHMGLDDPETEESNARHQRGIHECNAGAVDEEVREKRDQPTEKVTHADCESGDVKAFCRDLLCRTRKLDELASHSILQE